MIFIFKDRRKCSARDHLLGASLYIVFSLAGCSPAGKNISKDLYVIEGPSGLTSISILKNGVYTSKIPPSVISILSDEENVFVTQQEPAFMVKNNIATISHMGGFKYFIIKRNSNDALEVNNRKFLTMIILSKNIKSEL